jgi:hypothetical protein
MTVIHDRLPSAILIGWSQFMLRIFLSLFLACGTSICTAQVTVDSASARSVLSSVQDAKLTEQRAREVCEMPGNQGLIRKEISYGRKATTQSCADALLAAAQNKTPNPAFSFQFDKIKPRAPELSALINQIEHNPTTFQRWVVQRVSQFSPKDSKVAITGYLVAGGPSGGFSFGEPKFYLNLAYADEFDEAKVVMAHELYHAVQGAYAPKPKDWWSQKGTDQGPDHALAQQCSTNDQLLAALYEEGTASYVGDPFLLRDSKGPAAKKDLMEMQDGIAHIWQSVTLLELSVTGLNAPDPVSYDEVYAMGFYGPEIEYTLGYVMAKAIATDKGDAALAALLTQPEYSFTEQYMALQKYGLDYAHPKLESNTVAAVKRLRTGCPRPGSSH